MGAHLIRALRSDQPDATWATVYQNYREGYRAWFLAQGELNRPSYVKCRTAIRTHLPELEATWERLIELVSGDDIDARLLSLYCPTPYLSGCSQAVWTRYTPILVRNYDYDPSQFEGIVWQTEWNGTPVIAMSDSLWGVIDGMNASGLSVSLAFGGREEVGEGFGIPLILRYILEFCTTTAEAISVLQRVPTHMCYNITFLDAAFRIATVEVGPGMQARVTHRPYAVNHQGDFEFTNYAIFSKSFDRQQALVRASSDPNCSIASFIGSFAYSPLWATNYGDGFGTLYTAVYNPGLRAMEYRWPQGQRMIQSFSHFEPQSFSVFYP